MGPVRNLMATITVPLTDEQLQQLRQMAERAAISEEELAGACIEEMLNRSRRDFADAAKYVLQKNAELYRRLG
jgi:hypothetical protein